MRISAGVCALLLALALPVPGGEGFQGSTTRAIAPYRQSAILPRFPWDSSAVSRPGELPLSPRVSPPTSEPIEVVWLDGKLWSGLNDFKIQGDYAYCCMGYGLEILDVSDPASPEWLSNLYIPGAWGYQVDVQGEYAYVASGIAGLQVIDVTNPRAPKLETTFPSGRFACITVDVSGSYAYVGDNDLNVFIIDISDLAQPFIAGEVRLPAWHAEDIVVSGGYAYVAAHNTGLFALDVSDPATAAIVGHHQTVDRAWKLALSDTRAFVADVDGGMQIVDVVDPTLPTSVGSYVPQEGMGADVAVQGEYAYLTGAGPGLEILDISDPQTPTWVGNWASPRFAATIAVRDTVAYLGDWYAGFFTIDVSEPERPVTMGSHSSGAVFDVALDERHAYVAAGLGGLQVVDVDDSSLTPIGSLLLDEAFAVTVAGQFAYLAVQGTGMQIASIDQPSAPVLVGTYRTGMQYRADVAVSGELAYLATGYDGHVEIVNVSNPAAPFLVSSVETPGMAMGIFVADGYAYVADFTHGIQILDVRQPDLPALVSTCDTPRLAFRVIVRNGLAYVADGSNDSRIRGALVILDVSDPQKPTLVGSLETPGFAVDVAVSGDYVAVADGYKGLQVIDVSQPSSPEWVGGYLYVSAGGVEIRGDRAYVAGSGGLSLLRMTVPLLGDVNNDQQLSLSDVVSLARYLFEGGPAPSPDSERGDVDCNGQIEMVDIVWLVNQISRGTLPPC